MPDPGSAARAHHEAPLALFEIERRRRRPQEASAQEEAARVILATLWPVVEPAVHTAMTQTSWKARNKRVALDMAQAGAPLERVLEAHASATRRMGATVFSLQIVQDELARMGARSAAQAEIPVADDAAIERLR
jgi:hypothetical protein